MAQNQYMAQAQFEEVLKDLNYQSCEESVKKNLLDRATADLEADLAEKFIVPLTPRAGDTYAQMKIDVARMYATNKVVNALRAKIKEIVGFDKNKNLTGTIDSTERFINVHGIEYKGQIAALLKQVIDYQFKLLSQAQDAQTPVQHLGLARADNGTDPFDSGYGVL